MKLTVTEVKFDVGRKPVSFKVYHNLPDAFGLSIETAIDNWLFRTDKYTASSLCKYVMEKQDQYVCMTEQTFKRLNGK